MDKAYQRTHVPLHALADGVRGHALLERESRSVTLTVRATGLAGLAKRVALYAYAMGRGAWRVCACPVPTRAALTLTCDPFQREGRLFACEATLGGVLLVADEPPHRPLLLGIFPGASPLEARSALWQALPTPPREEPPVATQETVTAALPPPTSQVPTPNGQNSPLNQQEQMISKLSPPLEIQNQQAMSAEPPPKPQGAEASEPKPPPEWQGAPQGEPVSPPNPQESIRTEHVSPPDVQKQPPVVPHSPLRPAGWLFKRRARRFGQASVRLPAIDPAVHVPAGERALLPASPAQETAAAPAMPQATLAIGSGQQPAASVVPVQAQVGVSYADASFGGLPPAMRAPASASRVSDARPLDALRPVFWPESAQPLQALFAAHRPRSPFGERDWRYVRVPMACGGSDPYFWVGVQVKDDRVRRVAYAIAGSASQPPPHGVTGYHWRQGVDCGYWTRTQIVRDG